MMVDRDVAEEPTYQTGPALGIVTFLLTTLSMATVGLLVPLGVRVGAELGLAKAQFGACLSLFSVPSAILSMPLGSIGDRIGARKLIFLGAVIAIGADLLVVEATSAGTFRFALLIAGVGFAAITVGSPALIIANLTGGLRTGALSLWSTYAPVGVAAGFLLAVPFTGTGRWRAALCLHAALLTGMILAAAWVMRTLRFNAPPVRRASLADIVSVARHVVVVRLGLALAIPSGLSYGTSLLAPSYIAATTRVGIASAATLVAVAKIVVAMAAGLFTGWLVSRRVRPRLLFATLVLFGLAGQVALFYPDRGLIVSLVGLNVWLFAYVGIAATAFATLPVVFSRHGEIGAANGLISQLTSCLSFLAPIIYFRDESWPFFPAICAAGMLVALALFPPSPSVPRPAGAGRTR